MFTNTNDTATDPLAKLRAWEPMLAPAMYEAGRHGYRDTDGIGAVSYRSDTGAALGLVGPRYRHVPHRETCALFDELQRRNVVRDLRAGELAGGRRIYIQATPVEGSELEVLPGCPVQARLTLVDCHDGGAGLGLVDTAIVVVCLNTAQRAYREGKGRKLRHVASVEERFREAVAAVHASVSGFAKDVATFRQLARTPQSHDGWRTMLDCFWPMPDKPAADTTAAREAFENARANVQEQRNRLSWALEYAPGAKPGTRWGAYQAVTYYTSHEAGRATSRFESTLTGDSARLQREVLAHLLN